MTGWSTFPEETEPNQARFLLDTAMTAWNAQYDLEEIDREVRGYLELAYAVLDGQHEKLPQLICFIEDPEMKHDFCTFSERIKNNKKASAALDLASYACGFVSRLVATASGYGPLPDPVLESLPDIYEYFQERSRFLGI